MQTQFGDYKYGTARAAAILTNSYVAADTITEASGYNSLMLQLYFTIGSLTSCEIKIEKSMDGTNFTRVTNIATSGATNTLTLQENTFTATGNYEILLTNLKANFIKVSAKGTGTVTSSSLKIDYTLGVV
jgi:hypothetical protein